MTNFDYNQLTYVQAHCDMRVLHSPGSCEYCDKYPESQEQRITLGVLFTDDSPYDNPGKIPCPAILARGWQRLSSWGGNQPHRENMSDEEIAFYNSVESNSSRVMYGDPVKRHKGDPDPHDFEGLL